MKIQFYPSSKEVAASVPPPRPAGECVPQWYANTPTHKGGIPDIDIVNGYNATVKACAPFADAMRGGYVQETWCDLWIKDEEVTGLEYFYSASPELLSLRGEPLVPVGEDFYNYEFVWKSPWIPRVPKGYSVLYTPPINHFTLPFVSATGLVDSDVFFHVGNWNYPFYIRKGFTGIIPRGTPMYQMIPVKRDDWESTIEPWNEDDHVSRSRTLNSLFLNRYRRQFHQKKRYR